jgi:hypothetical protein
MWRKRLPTTGPASITPPSWTHACPACGFNLLRRLKKLDSAAKICFLTAFEMYQSEFENLFPDLVVTGFLRKPILISESVLQVNKMTS